MNKKLVLGIAAAAALGIAAVLLVRPGQDGLRPSGAEPEVRPSENSPGGTSSALPASAPLPSSAIPVSTPLLVSTPLPSSAPSPAPSPGGPQVAAPNTAVAPATESALPPGSPAEPAASAPLSAEQFRALTTKTLHELPTAAQMRDVTADEAHGYPEPLAKTGPLLGRIAQAVQDQPALKDQATEFYLSCVEDREILIPVRALCYSHIIKDPKAPPPESLPPEVVRLAKLVPVEK